MEIWKDIKGYEGLYQISNLGRVKSLPRNGTILEERILKQSLTKRKYLTVILCKNNLIKNKQVHRLVAENFIPNIHNKPIINHINGIKTDNRVENLEWCTYSENNFHAIKTGLRPSLRGKQNKNSKIIYKIDKYNNKIIEIFYGIGEIERRIKRDASAISKCCRKCKNYKTAYGFKWCYKEDYENI